jgi:C-terminal processing protease CtpA/Prc
MRGTFLTLRVAKSAGTLAILLALIVPSARAAETPAQSPPAPGTAAAAKKDGSRTVQRQKQLAEEKELLRLFADTLEQVKLKYVDSGVSDRQLIEAAIRGMISELDPYSSYIPPEDLEQFRRGVTRR